MAREDLCPEGAATYQPRPTAGVRVSLIQGLKGRDTCPAPLSNAVPDFFNVDAWILGGRG
jgi:hypothetical protein